MPMAIQTPEDRELTIQTLRNRAGQLGGSKLYAISLIVLNDSRFSLWTGSSRRNVHHYGDGGLAKHTLEVVELMTATCATLHVNDLSAEELFLSALFHDVGKIWDYEKVDGVWVGSKHKRLIHHVTRSAIAWSDAVAATDFYWEIKDKVLHNILAHHGQIAWGSPVTPANRSAWLLHLCDCLSARLDDGDTLED